MKKQFTLFLLALLAATQTFAAVGDTFTQDTPNGKLKYTVTSTSPNEVKVEAATKATVGYKNVTNWEKLLQDYFDSMETGEQIAAKFGLLTAQWADVHGNLEIPETVTNNGVTYTVTEIAANGFQNSANPTTLDGLTNVKFPSTLKKIGESAFETCPLLGGKILIPGSVETVSAKAFNNCLAITDLVLEEGVKTVEQYAFDNTRDIKTITLPSTLTTVNKCAFRGIIAHVKADATIICCGATPPTWGPYEKAWEAPFIRKYPSTVSVDANKQFPPILKLYYPATAANYSWGGFQQKIDAGHHLTIKSYGYATMYWGEKAIQLPENLTARTYHVNGNGQLTLGTSYNGGDVIAAGTAVVVEGAYDKNGYNLNFAATAGTGDAQNVLHGTDAAATTTSDDANVYYYMLSLNSSSDANSAGFYWGAANGGAFTNGAHKAYLVVPQTASARSFISLNSDETTSIALPSVNTPEDQPCYNLQGQRVDKFYKGVVIVNGHKTIRK